MGHRTDQHSGGWGGVYARRAETWDEFDALPAPVRALFKSAPYRYSAARAVDYYQAGGRNVSENVRLQREAMLFDLRREVIRVYGPTHPQARR